MLNYERDIAEIRYMMGRTSKFQSLSGLAGVYPWVGVYITYRFYYFNPTEIIFNGSVFNGLTENLTKVFITVLLVLISVLGTAIFLSFRKADRIGEPISNNTAKRLVIDMAVLPLFIGGGATVLFLTVHSLIGLIASVTLIFYGLALFNAGKLAFDIKGLGPLQIIFRADRNVFCVVRIVLLGFWTHWIRPLYTL